VIEEKNNQVFLKVTVVPKSSKNEVVGIYNDMLKVKVTAAPEKGKANAAVIEVLAVHFKLKKSQIQLSSGETSRNKTFTLDISLIEAKKVLESYGKKEDNC